jgi:hypothetical protein
MPITNKGTQRRLRAPGTSFFFGKSQHRTGTLAGAMHKAATNPVEASFAKAGDGYVQKVFGVSPLAMQNHEAITGEACTQLLGRVNSLEAAMPNLEVYAEAMRRLTELEEKKQSLIAETLSATVGDAKAAQASIQKADAEIAKLLAAAGIDRQKYEQAMSINGQSAKTQFDENNRSFRDRLQAIRDGVRDRETARAVGEVKRQIGRGDRVIGAFAAGKGDTVQTMDALKDRPRLMRELELARAGSDRPSGVGGIGGALSRGLSKLFN